MEGFPGGGVFVTMVTVENESREGAWPGSSLIEAEAGHVETDSHEECRGMSLLRTGLNSIRLRSGSFRPGPAAHKPSRENINKLQSVGSPHVTDEEGFPAVAGTAAEAIDTNPRRPGSPAAQPKPPQGAATGSECFCVRGQFPAPSRPARAGFRDLPQLP